MPTPLQILLDPESLYILSMYLVLIVWEAIFPARKLPAIRFWRIKGIAAFIFFFYLSTYLPLAYSRWLPSAQLIDLSKMNLAVATVLGVLLYEGGLYVWHRSMHRYNVLWRVFHQMHHSAERLDTYGAFYFSPFDMIGFTLLGTLCFSIVLGLPAAAVTLILLITNFFSIFQHANIRTPVWMGYIIQRPESHAIHHAQDVHAFNYSDLPLFDILFRTFRNPKEYVKTTGFYEGASARIGEMLRFQDVSLPPASKE
ncbi:sterol desaturase family protein [Niastella populi]|uniref:Fatty acid hydroxylase n=1 Tax=Niastella populi TaxID=550983 RepID=A0A1V9EI42_9BACT|nr:sterol desaturase family protein [Niastella populi]OQP45731.1 fatty acid hydroxylase [Niastella populi]